MGIARLSHCASVARKSGSVRASRGMSLNRPSITFSKRSAHGSQEQVIWPCDISHKCRWLGASVRPHNSQRSSTRRARAKRRSVATGFARTSRAFWSINQGRFTAAGCWHARINRLPILRVDARGIPGGAVILLAAATRLRAFLQNQFFASDCARHLRGLRWIFHVISSCLVSSGPGEHSSHSLRVTRGTLRG